MYSREISAVQLAKLPIPERQGIYMVHARMVLAFSRYEKLLAQQLKRAQGCGCARCWREYEDLCKEIAARYTIPDEDGSPDEIQALIAQYAPQLPK